MDDRRLTKEFFLEEMARRTVVGNVLNFPHPVITIMTNGRVYGKVSSALSKRGVDAPSIPLNTAKAVGRYVFACIWDDCSPYTGRSLGDLAASCLRVATDAGMKKIHLPQLGGKDGAHLRWEVEKALFFETERLEELGKTPADYAYTIAPARRRA